MDADETSLPNMEASTSPITDKLSRNPSKQKGRQRTSSLELALNSQVIVDVVPRFLVVKKREGDFAHVSPFVIDKFFSAEIGKVTSVRKIREGLLVETATSIQSTKLLKLNKFQEFDITVTPHNSLNYSKGVVTCRDLLNCSLVEITENMKEEGVIDAKRITVRREGELVDTPSLILTFNKDTLPKKVKAGIYVLSVRPYIPAPMRCFKCQRFGHMSSKCNRSEICVCGKEPHIGSPCVEPLKCINCDGEHSARSRNCPVYKQEAAIQKIKIEEKIPYAEAKKKVKGSIVTPVAGVSYSQALTNRTLSQSNNLKDIVSMLAPEIVKICIETIQNSNMSSTIETPSFETLTNSITKLVGTQSQEENSTETDLTAVKDKRKRGDNTPSDAEGPRWEDASDDEEERPRYSGTTAPRQRKGKPGWKKGRPRKQVKR